MDSQGPSMESYGEGQGEGGGGGKTPIRSHIN